MSNRASMEIVVLFEDEVRLAAKAVAAFVALDEDAPDAEHHRASQNLLNACMVALAGADADDAVLVLGKKPNVKKSRTGKATP